MSDAEVVEFRASNNNIVVTNFDEKSSAPILKPTPAFFHAFHQFPDIMKTISGELLGFLFCSPKCPRTQK
jgi:hypothetical protein